MKKKIHRFYCNIPGELLATIMLCFALNFCDAGTIPEISFYKMYNFTNQTEHIWDVPIEATFFNECCDEEIHALGIAHIIVNDNILHLVVSDITGLGLNTGYSYVGRGASTQERTFPSEINGAFILRLNMTNEDGCSFKFKLTLILAVNANGEVTANIESIKTQCQP